MRARSVNIIADAQGFLDEYHQFVFKEVAYIAFTNRGYVLTTFCTNVESPKPFKDLHCPKTRRSARWLTRFFHNKDWDDAGIPYGDMKTSLAVFDDVDTIVYVKGEEKISWFRDIFKKATIRDLHSYGCPSLKQLRRIYQDPEEETSAALNNVKIALRWIINKMNLS